MAGYHSGLGAGGQHLEDSDDEEYLAALVQADRSRRRLLPDVELHELPGTPRPRQRRSNLIGYLGNLSISYNLGCLAIAVAVMTSHQDTVVTPANGLTADYPEPAWARDILLGTVFAGAVCGMAGMGYLADAVGRKRAMLLTLGLTALGALSSAVFTWGTASSVYGILAASRFVLGVGVGGIFPLSAVTSAEGTAAGEHMGRRVGWGFFFQAPGVLLPYLLALALLFLPASNYVTTLQFRIILGAGAIPALIVVVVQFFTPDVSPPAVARAAAVAETGFWAKLQHREHLRRLAGTGGTWFLYDVSYYGTQIFTPLILKSIFGDSETLKDTAWRAALVASVGLPAGILSIYLVKPLGGRLLNACGFVAMGVLFATLAVTYHISPSGLSDTKFIQFLALTATLNSGPGLATYYLPTVLYPPEVRGTFNGLSAASGKLGAVVGTFMYEPLASAYGISAVLWVQTALSLLGAAVSLLLLPDDRRILREQRQAEADHKGRPLLLTPLGAAAGRDARGGGVVGPVASVSDAFRSHRF